MRSTDLSDLVQILALGLTSSMTSDKCLIFSVSELSYTVKWGQ